MRHAQKPPPWRLLLLSLVVVLVPNMVQPHQPPHPFGGNWVIKIQPMKLCQGQQASFYKIYIPASGTVSEFFVADTSSITISAIVVSHTGWISGSVQSGRRDSPDIALTGQLFHGKVGGGSWFNAYGCEGIWTAAQE